MFVYLLAFTGIHGYWPSAGLRWAADYCASEPALCGSGLANYFVVGLEGRRGERGDSAVSSGRFDFR